MNADVTFTTIPSQALRSQTPCNHKSGQSPLQNSRHKTLPTLIPCDLCMFRLTILFTLCFAVDKAHGWGLGTLGEQSQMQGLIRLQPQLRPIILGMRPPWGLTLHIKTLVLCPVLLGLL